MHRCLVALAAVALIAAAPREDESATDLAPGLQGTWKCVAFEHDGRSMPPIHFRIVIAHDCIRYYNAGDELYLEERYQLGACGRMQTIDFRQVRSGDQAGFHLRGIYAFEDDELKLCWGDERPTLFASDRGGGRVVCRWKRVKP